MICQSDTPSTTIATMKMSESRGSMTRHITTDSTRRNGARTVMRKICWNACCRFCTSVVMRVTSPDVEYLSMSEKAKRWMFLYIARRRLAAKPVEATADVRPAAMPSARLMNAISNISPP